MAEAWLSTVGKLTGFFSANQIEASARRTELVFRAWKSGLHVATVTTTTKHSTLCYLIYGRMLLIHLTSALSSPLRATVWQHRELSLFKLVRHLQASAWRTAISVQQSVL